MAKKTKKKTAMKTKREAPVSRAPGPPAAAEMMPFTINGQQVMLPRSMVEGLIAQAITSQASPQPAIARVEPPEEANKTTKKKVFAKMEAAHSQPIQIETCTEKPRPAMAIQEYGDDSFDLDDDDDSPSQAKTDAQTTLDVIRRRRPKNPYGTKKINTAASTHYKGYQVLRRTLTFLEREKLRKGKPINQKQLIDALGVFDDKLVQRTYDTVDRILAMIEKESYVEPPTRQAITAFRKKWLTGEPARRG